MKTYWGLHNMPKSIFPLSVLEWAFPSSPASTGHRPLAASLLPQTRGCITKTKPACYCLQSWDSRSKGKRGHFIQFCSFIQLFRTGFWTVFYSSSFSVFSPVPWWVGDWTRGLPHPCVPVSVLLAVREKASGHCIKSKIELMTSEEPRNKIPIQGGKQGQCVALTSTQSPAENYFNQIQ